MLITDLKPDDKNANKGRKRGSEAVTHSLKELGAGRSILIDRDGRVIAGNKTLAAAVAAGVQDVIVVESDGTKIIAVKRTDLSLDDVKGRRLAVADNRTSELGLEWNPEVLAELSVLDLKPFFTDAETQQDHCTLRNTGAGQQVRRGRRGSIRVRPPLPEVWISI